MSRGGNTHEVYNQNNDIIKRSQDGVTGDDYFWSLCRQSHGITKRTCLNPKCQKLFRSTGPGKRFCSQCSKTPNRKFGVTG